MSTRRSSKLVACVRGALLFAAVPAGLVPAAALADPAAPNTAVLDEIVVTAQKRTENVQDVPISITAFSAEYLERLQTQRIADVLDFAPNVSRSSGPTGGADAFFFIRGVGQVDNSATVDPGVGVYVDEVYLGRIQGASLDLLDVDRVEVLRGPQGTLFGRNTIGGAVSVITKDPTDVYEGSVRAVLGSRDKRDLSGVLNVPLGDTTGLRLSAFTRNQDGWVRNVYTGQDFGRVEDVGGRLKFKWDFADSASATVTADYTRRRGSPANTSLLVFNPLAGPVAAIPPNPPRRLPGYTPTGVPYPFPVQPPGPPPIGALTFPATDIQRDILGNPDLGANSIPAELPETAKGVSLTLNFDFDVVKLKSITAYRDLDQKAAADLDGSAYSLYDARFDIQQDQLSQELQLTGQGFGDRLEWLLGAYYFREEADNDTFICQGTNRPWQVAGQNLPLPPPPPLVPFQRFVPGASTRLDGRCLRFVNRIALENTSLAGYANANYQLTDRWSAFAGLRYTRDEKQQQFDTGFDNTDGVASIFPLARFGGFTPQASPANPAWPQPTFYEESWSEMTPRIGVNFEPNEDLLFYASFAQGFKSGGFGARATPLAPIRPFDPETVDTFEVGFKSQFADDRVRLNGAIFQTDYSDIQLLILDPVTAQFETRNGGDNRVRGVEVELRALPIDRLDVTIGAGWLDNEYRRFAGVAQIDPGDKLPNSPEYTFDAGAEYRWPLPGGTFGLRADWNYRAEHWFQALNNPLDRQGGYGIVNARATFDFDQGLTVGIYGINLGDKRYFITKNDTSAVDSLGVATGNWGPGREYGIDVSFKF